jgi:hypothetical protein
VLRFLVQIALDHCRLGGGATQSPKTWAELFAPAQAVPTPEKASNFLFRKPEVEDWQKICLHRYRVHSR